MASVVCCEVYFSNGLSTNVHYKDRPVLVSVAYPEITARGYNKDMIAGSLARGGTLGLLIPPSLSFWIYGALTETSLGRLFLAGIVPGLMIGLMFMIHIFVQASRHPHIVPREEGVPSLISVALGFCQIWPLLLLIMAVTGGIIAGFATPTEAAGLGGCPRIS